MTPSSGPWHAETNRPTDSGSRPAVRVVQTKTGFTLGSFSGRDARGDALPRELDLANAHLASKCTEMLEMLERIRRTCHLTEDSRLPNDLDVLIADCRGEELPVDPEDAEALRDNEQAGDDEGDW